MSAGQERAAGVVQHIQNAKAATAADLNSPNAGALAGTGAGPGDEGVDPASEDFEFELGSTVYLFERNHDPETSAPRDGYQEPKKGKIVKITEDTDVIDVLTGGEDSPAITSHDVAHETDARRAGANYWSETAD